MSELHKHTKDCPFRPSLERLVRRFMEYRDFLMDEGHAFADDHTAPVTGWESDLAEMLTGDASWMPPKQEHKPDLFDDLIAGRIRL